MPHVTPYDIASRFIGIREIPGEQDNPFVMSMLKLDNSWPEHDEVPWCSAFVNYVCWLLRLPRSKSLRARSWLWVGRAVEVPVTGSCVVILKRGKGEQPGPDVLEAPGHVGFYSGLSGDKIHVLGGNQSNTVSVAAYPRERVLGYREVA